MTDHVVELNIPEWRAIYPQYPDVSDAQLQGLWGVACDLIGNSPSSRIPYDPPRADDDGLCPSQTPGASGGSAPRRYTVKRKTILYATLCHLAYLTVRGDLVGNVTNAAQGSVNAGLAYMQKANSRWWDQSPCGATAWVLLTPYRSGGCYVSGK